jgi:hypothetical protein
MRIALIVLAVTALLLLCVAATHADALINPGFETGDLTGWTTEIAQGGSASVVTTWPGSTATYLPPDGNYFVAIGGGDLGYWQGVTQNVNLKAGDILQGWAAFDAHDSLPNDDEAFVGINGNGGGLWYETVSFIGDYTSGPWTHWSWTAPSDGLYTLGYYYYNYSGSTSGNQSYALFDGPQVLESGRVPEPGTMALLLMGLPMAALLRRRSSK